MRSAGGGRRGTSRSTAILLAASLLATALLALQAQAAFVYQRGIAEHVLRDYAQLAASELIRRATATIGYEGYAALLARVGRRLGPSGLPADLAAQLAADPEPAAAAASALARRCFAAAPGRDLIAFTGGAPDDGSGAWLLSSLAPRLAERAAAGAESDGATAVGSARAAPAAGPLRAIGAIGAMGALHGVLDGEPRSFVYAPVRGIGDWEVVGFEVDLRRLGGWFSTVLERGALLPSFVGDGEVSNASLAVVVRDHGGVERFRHGAGPAPRSLGAELGFGDAYSGILAGTIVQVAIDPAAARRLVIGGLPRSRLPLVIGLLALSTGLVVAALVQLRRERALQRLREEFVASVSHELRTPLTQIRMFAETLLLERVRSEDERRRALEILDREARRLAHLVENVLQFSRSERGAIALARETQPLAPVVREVLEQFEPLLAGAAARLTARLDETASAAFDPDALRQVLSNLLDNAVKYGPRGQELRVELEPIPGGARIAVDDQGPGVPAPERRRVFERFQRLARDRGSAIGGAGIGLAVVRDLVVRQGGRVWVDDGERGGARFVVELPS